MNSVSEESGLSWSTTPLPSGDSDSSSESSEAEVELSLPVPDDPRRKAQTTGSIEQHRTAPTQPLSRETASARVGYS